MVARRPKRLRRSAEDARALILDAAEKRLSEGGPASIRLQEVAKDAGISHPTILHHFGSREGLVEAVVMRALEGVGRDVLGAFASEAFEAPDATDLLRRVMSTLADRGHARLLAWLALEGHSMTDSLHMLRSMADVLHSHRERELGVKVPFEDTLFVLVLSSLALIAEGIVGKGTWDSAGLANDPAAPERFHGWFVKLLNDHMHGLGEMPQAPKKTQHEKTAKAPKTAKKRKK